MQLGNVPRPYPSRCEQEQSRLHRFAARGLTGEETGDDASEDDSSHEGEFWYGVGFKRSLSCILDGGCVLPSLDVGGSGGLSR